MEKSPIIQQHLPEDNELPKKEHESFEISAEKKDIEEVFRLNPELKQIGSKEQYKEYLKTIFPESKIQDIVWHGTESESSTKIKKDGFARKTNFSTENAVYFGREYNYYGGENRIPVLAKVGIKNIQIDNSGQINNSKVWKILKPDKDAILQTIYNLGNSVHNNTLDGKQLSFEERGIIEEEIENKALIKIIQNTGIKKEELFEIFDNDDKRDSFLENYINQFGVVDIPFGQLVVKPEQVHILGSKSDIGKFKEFVSKQDKHDL